MQTILTALVLLLISYGLTALTLKVFIRFMNSRSYYQTINPDVAEHQHKVNTPTAGGLCFIITTTILAFIATDITHPYVYIPILSLWIFGAVGMADDLLKLRKKENQGLPSVKKFALQILAAALLYYIMKSTTQLELNTVSAFWNPQTKIDIGLWFPIAFLLYMVIFVNAVNISDGLDGLATSVSISPIFLLFAIAIPLRSLCAGTGAAGYSRRRHVSGPCCRYRHRIPSGVSLVQWLSGEYIHGGCRFSCDRRIYRSQRSADEGGNHCRNLFGTDHD